MIIKTTNHASPEYNQEMTPLIEPDMNGKWAVRYVWIQHRTNNEVFIENYFKKQQDIGTSGLNVRKNTTHLQQFWDVHNKIFETSAINGDLVWRVKTYNNISDSIDYIEVWRDVETVSKYFSMEYTQPVTVSDGFVWTIEYKKMLSTGVFDSGFVSMNWLPYPTISRAQSIDLYKKYVSMATAGEKCIINTKFNLELHPLVPA